MPRETSWNPMHEAPQAIDRIWLNHLTLGPILAEGRPGRWYAPSAAHQVWRWYRPDDAETLEPFSGWLPYEALLRPPGVPATQAEPGFAFPGTAGASKARAGRPGIDGGPIA